MYNICIAFNGGSYGTFIEWCLHYFSNSNFSQELPFTDSGNSHKFIGNHLLNIKNVTEFVNNSNSDKNAIVRFHPKTHEQDSILNNLTFVKENFKKVIIIHPTEESLVWNIHNKFEKIWSQGWLWYNETDIVKNLTKWEINNLDSMAVWQKREFLSFYIYKQHLMETELLSMEKFKSKLPDALFISIDTLRDNFKNTIIKIFDYCDMQIINYEKIDVIYQHWIEKQYHKDKDNLVKNITHAIINNVNLNWQDEQLTIVDEAMIQMGLRNNGIEIKCFQLDKFPSSTNEIRPLLYAS